MNPSLPFAFCKRKNFLGSPHPPQWHIHIQRHLIVDAPHGLESCLRLVERTLPKVLTTLPKQAVNFIYFL